MSGAADDVTTVREFAAGPLRATFALADLRYLSIGHVETIRRIYVGVRDANWGTVHPHVGNVEARQEGNGFRIEFDAEHVQGDVNFAWHGLIVAEAPGPSDVRVRYEMNGVARSRLRTNRTGICVLHPVKECAGAECRVEHPGGSGEASMFPIEVAPHQPFMNVRGLAYRAGGCVDVELRFEGDVFETEDQRNWTDGSYKTYCRPLSLPFPYVLEPGQRVRQVVEIRLNGAVASSALSAPTVTLRGGTVATVPPIGLGWTQGTAAGDRDVALIRAMRPSHLRVEIRPCKRDWEPPASRAAEQVARIGCPLEIAAHLSCDVAGELDALARWARRARPEVGRWVFYDQGKPVTSPETIALARRALRDLAGAAMVGGGTVGNFAEVNRARTAVAGMDFVAFPVNPQTHAADDLSLMENLEGQGPTVATARDFTRAPVAVGPVVLHRRPDPFAAGKGGDGAEVIAGDPRQQTLFGAAWTLGSLKALIEAGAASLTYYETVGAFGVLDDGFVFPLYHVLADVVEYAGGQVLDLEQPSLRTCAALAIRRGGAVRVIVANTQDRSIRIGLGGFSGYRVVGRLELTRATLGDATARPIEFRAGASGGLRGEVPHEVPNELELPAYGVVRLDLTEGR